VSLQRVAEGRALLDGLLDVDERRLEHRVFFLVAQNVEALDER